MRQLVALVVVLAGALALRWAWPHGLGLGDPALYAEAAAAIARGEGQLGDLAFQVRFGLLLPVAACFRLFGVSDASALLFPQLCSMLCVYLVYRLGRLLGDALTGLLAAVLLGCLPLALVQSGDLHADLPMATGLAVFLVAVLEAVRAASPASARGYRLLAAAGLGFGCLCKLTGFVFLPAACLLCLHLARRDRRVLWVPVLVGVGLAGEMLAYGLATGDPLFRIHAETGQGYHQRYVRQEYADPAANLVRAFLEVPGLLLRPFPFAYAPMFGYHFLLFAVAAVAVWRRERSLEWRGLWLWLAAVYAPLGLLVVDLSFTPAQIRYPRTLEPLVVPCMVVAARFLASLRPRLRLALLLLVVVVGLLSAGTVETGRQRADVPTRDIHRQLRLLAPTAKLQSDPFTCGLVRFLDGFRAELACESFAAERRAGLVIVSPSVIRAARYWAGFEPPSWLDSRADWVVRGEAVARERRVGGWRRRWSAETLGELFFGLQAVPADTIRLYEVPGRAGGGVPTAP